MKKLIVCLVVLALVGSANANLLIYGGFEDGLTGVTSYVLGDNIPLGDPTSWLVTLAPADTAGLDDGYANHPSQEGSRFYLLGNSNHEARVEQSFATVIGQEYDLSFYANSWGGGGDADITV